MKQTIKNGLSSQKSSCFLSLVDLKHVFVYVVGIYDVMHISKDRVYLLIWMIGTLCSFTLNGDEIVVVFKNRQYLRDFAIDNQNG